jgi:hypothetical protein
MAENIDGTVGGSGLFNTKIPALSEAADIQAALRLYHYGEDYELSNTDPEELKPVSLAKHLQNLQDNIETVDAKGIGSIYSVTEPTTPLDGYVWMNPATTSPIVSVASWQKISSGSLSGSSLEVSSIDGEKVFIVLKDWSHDNVGSIDFSLTFNEDIGPNYVNTGGLLSSSHLGSPEFPDSGTYDMTVTVDLANTTSALKPVSTIADISTGSYFGYYKSTNPITSVQINLPSGTEFDSGTYEVWSYE